MQKKRNAPVKGEGSAFARLLGDLGPKEISQIRHVMFGAYHGLEGPVVFRLAEMGSKCGRCHCGSSNYWDACLEGIGYAQRSGSSRLAGPASRTRTETEESSERRAARVRPDVCESSVSLVHSGEQYGALHRLEIAVSE